MNDQHSQPVVDADATPESIRSQLYAQEHRLLLATRRYFFETWGMDKDAPLRVGARAGLMSSLIGRASVAVPIAGGGLLSLFLLWNQTSLLREQNALIAAQNQFFQEQISKTDRRAAASEELASLAQRQALLETLHEPSAKSGVRAHAVRALAAATPSELPIDLLSTSLQGTVLSDIDLSRAQFRDCDLRDAFWNGVALGTDLTGVRLAGADLRHCGWKDVRGEGVELAVVTFPVDVFEEKLLGHDRVVLTADGYLVAESKAQLRPGTHYSLHSSRRRWPVPEYGKVSGGRSISSSIEIPRGESESDVRELEYHTGIARSIHLARSASHFDGFDAGNDRLSESSQEPSGNEAYLQAYMMLADTLAHFAGTPYKDRDRHNSDLLYLGSERYQIEWPEWPGVRFAIAEIWGGVGSLPRWENVRWEMAETDKGLEWRLLADIVPPGD